MELRYCSSVIFHSAEHSHESPHSIGNYFNASVMRSSLNHAIRRSPPFRNTSKGQHWSLANVT